MKTKGITLLLVIILISACQKDKRKPKYTNFKILSVTLTSMPSKDGSVDWDPFNGPDVFFNMEDAYHSVLFKGSGLRYNDIAPSDIPLSWTFPNAYQITDLNTTYYVTVYDYDLIDPDDQVGYVGFIMKEHKSGYPKAITKNSGDLSIKITGEWY